jgi:hypothetical protein
MIKNLIRKYKRYLIEFLVIVLGVSVSFMAEQGRQRVNEHFEVKSLIEKAMTEAKFFILVDSFKVHFGARLFIQDIISGQSFRADSMHLVLANGLDNNLDINEYFPSLFSLTKRTDLSNEQLAVVKTAASLARMYKDLDSDLKKLREQLHLLYLKYGITDDYIRLENVQLEQSKERGEVVFWNPLVFNIQYSGRYGLFSKDQEVLDIFKKIYIILVEQELMIIELRKVKRQAVVSGY